MAQSTSTKKKTDKPVPTAALKRFAADLQSDSAAQKFLQINRERVSQFIEKQPFKEDSSSKNAKSGPSKIPGIMDYTFMEKVDSSSLISLQRFPEFQSSLGIRSRFGEGDGSFFDNWLNSDVQQSKLVVDKDGLPVMRFNYPQIQTGFKKHIDQIKSPQSKEGRNRTFVKSYEERRRERLAREAGESLTADTVSVASKNTLPSLNSPKSFKNDLLSDGQSVSTIPSQDSSRSGRLPNINIMNITPAERDNYFGQQARSTFFDYFRSLSRQQLNMSRGSVDERAMQQIDFINLEKKYGKGHEDRFIPSDEGSGRHLPTLASEDFSMPSTHSTHSSLSGSDIHSISSHSAANQADYTAFLQNSDTYQRLRERQKDLMTTQHENKMLLAHLAVPDKPVTMPFQRPLSARTLFLIGCATRGIHPQPSWIIRRELTTILNISSLG